MQIPEHIKKYLSPAQLQELEMMEARQSGQREPQLTFEQWLAQNPQYAEPAQASGKNKNPTVEAAKAVGKDYAKKAFQNYLKDSLNSPQVPATMTGSGTAFSSGTIYNGQPVASMSNGGTMMSTGEVIPASEGVPVGPAGSDGVSATGSTTGTQVAQGLGGAAQAYQGYNQWQNGNKVGGGLNMATGAANVGAAAGSSMAGEAVPYLNTALGAYNVGNALYGDNNMTAKERSRAALHQGGLAVANAFTYGLAGLAEMGIRKAWGKEAGEVDKFMMKYDPITRGLASVIGGKNREQMNRDVVRKSFKDGGLVDQNYNLALANGNKFNIGADGSQKLYNVDLSTPEAERDLKIVAPLAQLLTGGDKKLGSDFSGYFTNAVRSGGDVLSNAKEMYKNAGVTSWDQARAGLQELKDMGKISGQELAVYDQGLANIFGNKGLEAPMSQLSTAGQKLLGKPSSVPASAATPVPRPTYDGKGSVQIPVAPKPTATTGPGAMPGIQPYTAGKPGTPNGWTPPSSTGAVQYSIPVAPTQLTKPAVQAVTTPTPIKRVTFPTRGYSATGILGGK